MNEDVKLLVSRLSHLAEWKALESYLNELRAKKIDALLSGALTHEQYVQAAGYVAGLDVVLTAPVNPLPRPARQLSTTRH